MARHRPLIRAKAEFGGILVSRPETETSPFGKIDRHDGFPLPRTACRLEKIRCRDETKCPKAFDSVERATVNRPLMRARTRGRMGAGELRPHLAKRIGSDQRPRRAQLLAADVSLLREPAWFSDHLWQPEGPPLPLAIGDLFNSQ